MNISRETNKEDMEIHKAWQRYKHSVTDGTFHLE